MLELVSASTLSKIFFNRENRLTIWHTVMQRSIDPPELFRAKEIYEELFPNAHRGDVGRELRDLASVGAIALRPNHDDPRSKYYERVESSLWPVVQELASKTIELSSASKL